MAEQVFISYKSEERTFAKRLCDWLQLWGYATWWDEQDIPSGTDQGSRGWQRAIMEGVQKSNTVVGVMTPLSLDSDYVQSEWKLALDNEKRLLLLRLKEVSPGEIPPPYNLYQYIDLVDNEAAGLEKLRATLKSPAKLSPAERVRAAAPDLPIPDQRPDDQVAMLHLVRDIWVKGILRPALSEREALTIQHQFKPDAVLKSPDSNAYRLPPTVHVVDIFNALNQEILILGEPGAGKTVMLLQLADALIDEALADARKRIPVVLNLASWARKRESLDKWIVSEVARTYSVPPENARKWLSDNRIILLLDGLDEVNEKYRDACVASINAFRAPDQYRFIDTVVCSRVKDYEALTTQLDLRGAILLQDLTKEQINDYLSAPELNNLRDVVQGDPLLQELAKTPFLLNTMAYAYQDTSAIGLAVQREERLEDLFDTYIEKRFDDDAPNHFDLKSSRRTLAWLATNMQAYVQTVFHVDDLDGQWLRRQPQQDRQYRLFQRLMSLTLLVPLALVFGALGLVGVSDWAAVALGALGLLIGLLLFSHPDTFGHAETLRIHKPTDWSGVLLAGSILGLIVGPFVVIESAIPSPIIATLALTCIIPLLAAVATWLISGGSFSDKNINAFLAAIMIALVVPLIGFPALLIAELIGSGWLTNGLVSGGITAAITVSFVAVEIGTLDLKVSPNAGFRSALKVSVVSGLLIGILTGILFTVLRGLTLGLLAGTAFGLMYGLIWCGTTVLQHVFLRLILTLSGSLPLDFAAFLKDMTGKNILRPLGGGYIFRHRYMLEYFAETSEQIAVLIQLFDDPGPARNKAVAALTRIGPVAVDPLVKALNDPSTNKRKSAAETLGSIGDTRAVEPLIKTLDDQVTVVRSEAISALSKLKDIRAVDPLIALLSDNDDTIRKAAVGALGQLKDTRAVDPLTRLLGDQDYYVPREAVGALGKIGGPGVLETLVGVLNDQSSKIRDLAAAALGSLGDTRAVEPLLSALGDKNTEVRSAAARALGHLGDTRAIEPLLSVLWDANARSAAADALGNLGDVRAVEPLIGLLGDNDNYVRSSAAAALGKLKDARAVEPLIRILEDKQVYVRDVAAEALEQIGKPAVPALIAALDRAHWMKKRLILCALVEIDTDEARQAVRHKGRWLRW